MATLKSFMLIAVISVLAKPSNERTLLVFLHEVSVQELLGKLDTLELEQLDVRIDSPVERHRDLPGPLERLRILDRGLVLDVILVDELVALRDLHHGAVVIAGTIEPRLVVVA